jgi:adenylate cyclase
MTDSSIREEARAIIEWLASDECHRLTGGEFIQALGKLLLKYALPIDHVIRALNPTLFGRSITWAPGEPVTPSDLQHGEELLKEVQEGPLGYVASRREWLVLQRDDPRWGTPERLFKGGLTELCIAPMIHGIEERSVSAVSFGTRKQ